MPGSFRLASASKNGTATVARPTIRRISRSAKTVANKAEDPYKLEGLDRVVAILDVLGESDDSLSLAEICNRMELRKSTAHRALMALERTGLIERAPGHRYRLGLKLYDMGNRAVEQIDLRERIHPFLHKLALRIGETVHLGVLHKTRVVYIDKMEPINRRVCISSRTGTSNPVYSTSLGKAILAFMPDTEASPIIAGIRFKAFTSKTLTTREELMQALERVRSRGYAIDDEEMEIGTRCVGAPIFDADQRPIAALSVSGSAVRLAAHCVPSIAEHVMRCCTEVSAKLRATMRPPQS
ncbi:MAG TPA: IclR family transcriptional regulator [Terracidiphilus sp.]|jgi:DNA-binding IclR family transcriptional regulator|nr:IclR family transcriptional regulator [Terracidiphilus sp.]